MWKKSSEEMQKLIEASNWGEWEIVSSWSPVIDLKSCFESIKRNALSQHLSFTETNDSIVTIHTAGGYIVGQIDLCSFQKDANGFGYLNARFLFGNQSRSCNHRDLERLLP